MQYYKNKLNYNQKFCFVVKSNCYGLGDELCRYFNDFVDYTVNMEHYNALFDKENRERAESYCRALFNIFETVVECERPAVTELKRIMLDCGAAGAMMSGSGTSVFGIFANEETAKSAREALIACGADAHVCYPM